MPPLSSPAISLTTKKEGNKQQQPAVKREYFCEDGADDVITMGMEDEGEEHDADEDYEGRMYGVEI